MTPVNIEVWKAWEQEPSGNLLSPSSSAYSSCEMPHLYTCERSVVIHLPLGSLEASTMLITQEHPLVPVCHLLSLHQVWLINSITVLVVV